MDDKQFTDELFKRMYDLGYRKAEIKNDVLFFFNSENEILNYLLPRVKVASTCFEEKNQFIDVTEYLGIVDWNKVKVDTPILVRELDGCPWKKRYFAFYDGRIVQAWKYGATSWSIENKRDIISWPYAKLAEV
nr:MAG TPA: hypothetical protein [Caudoviricetes sp.]